ncbi:uncharacterized protein LOC129752854 [Uranotaenia lowii]|uniref:uncharacterized protein LOC129752854 n=1 Tax=Uranotaenia lowii TaxID=190385 RepID=UPI0024797876|nr:uncharacterized protein LOC129752854 [Uranotaenia lowii]
MPIKPKPKPLKELQVKLRGLHISFDNLYDFMQQYRPDTKCAEVKVRLEQLNRMWDRMNEAIDEVEAHEDTTTDEDTYAKQRVRFENQYYELKSFLLDRIKDDQDQVVLNQTARTLDNTLPNHPNPHVRLPQISLPKFNGKIEEWLTFRDLYTSLIHWQADLPEIEKFHYLRSQLEGEALSVIDALPLTRANYTIAWELLSKRYTNSKILRKRQVQALFDLPVMKRECSSDLHILLESFEKIIKSLDQVIQPADYKDAFLLHILSSRLDGSTRRGWEEISSTTETDTLKDLTDFLQRRVRVQCRGKHHTLVCFKGKATDHQQPENPDPQQQRAANDESPPKIGQLGDHRATAVVLLDDGTGHRVQARALLDSAAECNLISMRVRRKLKVKGKASNVEVVGIQGLSSKVQGKIRLLLHSRIRNYSQSMDFYVLPKISSPISAASIDTRMWNIPVGIELADPSFLNGEQIDLVLGAESFFEFFVTGNRIHLGNELPMLVDSVFGWVVAGRYTSKIPLTSAVCNTATMERLDELVERFWRCEEIESKQNYSPEEAKCEAHFVNTTTRSPSGRYIVSLPKTKSVIERLSGSKAVAERRFYQIERRLARDANLYQQYSDFLQEYESLGHMRRLTLKEMNEPNRIFLPHHPVVKEASTTTKLRVVFDASAKTPSEFSLNDGLLVGPIIQEDLRSIILRSRTRQVMIVADIEKMFRQIEVFPADRRLQCILWRPNPNVPLAGFELSTVTYGTKPAPFLATRVLHQLTIDEGDRFPLAAVALKEDVYMDDTITGSDDLESARHLRIEMVEMTMCAGFKLRKFASNFPSVLDGLPEEDLAIPTNTGINLDPDPMVKILGLIWMPHTDELRFGFPIPTQTNNPLTKRKILSQIATLFDPLGLIGAVITKAKIFMQLLWRLVDDNNKPLSWDSILPERVEEEWISFGTQIPRLLDLRVERLVTLSNPTSTQFHIFTDASEKAYGACAYLRTENSAGQIKIALLSSKSRVAPLKSQSIPRLELCGAVMGAELFTKVKQAMRLSVESFFWTDSTTVLRWLQGVPATWNTYVANRVSAVQTLTENCFWNHVPGEQNPADLISRGIQPAEIQNNSLWWHGPDWLSCSSDKWPKSGSFTADGEDEERKRVVLVSTQARSFITEYVERYSNYTTMVRHTVYWLRLINYLRKGSNQLSGPLRVWEIRQAEARIIQLIQAEEFHHELRAISKGRNVPLSSPLRWFVPIVGSDGLLRVGGRLGQSRESDDTKHPIVLPSKHDFTKLLIRYYHIKLLHAGPQLILNSVRLRYWPLGGRNLARKICHECVRCYRTKPAMIQQFMAELPASRVTPARAFTTTGVDYFGPLYVRPGFRRAAVKAYVAVFVCFASKAVHLEIVTDLSTARFLQALRRFTSRRGKCAVLHSDNGTNFVGAKNKMTELMEKLRSTDFHDEMARQCADEGMQWKFNPPGAPHFGGLWEAAVRSAKQHLVRVLGESVATYEDMVTLLAEVECCLNSRPLTQLKDDPEDLRALTPGHFLIGAELQALPDEDFQDCVSNRLPPWDLAQQRVQHFWSRWRKEYLNQLQARNKWWKPAVKVEVGKLVVIRNDNLPPTRWRMGRITEAHPGPDGVVRVVSLKTASGSCTRPVTQICILPVQMSTEAEEGEKQD